MVKIVIGVDRSETAGRALSEGSALATALGAEVHLVTAFSDGASGPVAITEERMLAERDLEQLASRAGLHGAVVHALPTKPDKAIVQVATEQQADMIVIGNVGAQGARRVLGSIASAVVAHAPCSVLVVKTS